MLRAHVVVGLSPKLWSRNGLIATEPMVQQQVKTTTASGFATIEQRSTLTALRVLVAYPGSATMPALEVGDTVMIRSECFVQGWAKRAYEVGAGGARVSAIFVPESEVLVYTRVGQ